MSQTTVNKKITLAVIFVVVGLSIGFGAAKLSNHSGQTKAVHVSTKNDATTPSSGAYPCVANQQDTCISVPSLDFYPAGSESASNSELTVAPNDINKQIAGRITSINGDSIVIKTSSGRQFTITYPADALAAFNARNTETHVTATVGDELFVIYYEPAAGSSTTISPQKIQASSLVLKGDVKIKDSSNFQKY